MKNHDLGEIFNIQKFCVNDEQFEQSAVPKLLWNLLDIFGQFIVSYRFKCYI